MTEEEQAQQIQIIYDEAIAKLDALVQERNNLVQERKDAIRGYINDLEVKKTEAIRMSLGLLTNKQ
jgi:hypothetical protein